MFLINGWFIRLIIINRLLNYSHFLRRNQRNPELGAIADLARPLGRDQSCLNQSKPTLCRLRYSFGEQAHDFLNASWNRLREEKPELSATSMIFSSVVASNR